MKEVTLLWGGNCFFTDEISDLKGLLHFETLLLNNSPE